MPASETRPKFIVTGANGFLGARVAARLHATGDVLAVDRYFGTRPRAPDPRTTIDLAQPLPDAPELRDATIVHAAGVAGDADRQALWEGNVTVTFNVLDWAVRHAARHVVLLSTGDVYAPAAGHRHRETDPVAPWHFGGHSKRLAEEAAHAFAALYGLPVTVLRIFHPYGSGATAGLLAAARQAVRAGQAPVAPLRGSSALTPVHCDDVVSAVACVVRAAPARTATYNVCGDDVLPFAEIVRLLGGTAAAPAPGTAPEGDELGDHRSLDDACGWRPARDASAIAADE